MKDVVASNICQALPHTDIAAAERCREHRAVLTGAHFHPVAEARPGGRHEGGNELTARQADEVRGAIDEGHALTGPH